MSEPSGLRIAAIHNARTGAASEEWVLPQFHFYWNRDAMVWNNSGDRVYLRSADGRFVTAPFPIP